MAVNLTNAEKALKTVYLDAVSEQLNGALNPLLSRIKQSTEDVYGKEVRKLAIYGINGGVSAGTEEGNLPSAMGNNYEQFVSTLKNLYGTIEITDKAIRASENNSGAFISLLNAEMDGLIKASNFNFGRMLFGDGSGKLANVISIEPGIIKVDSVANLMEGMLIDLEDPITESFVDDCTGRKILSIDRDNKTVKLSGDPYTLIEPGTPLNLYLHGSWFKEITGLKSIFDKTKTTLYGVDKTKNQWINPYVKENVGEISEQVIQKALDSIEERSGSGVNFIVCSWGVRRALQKALANNHVRMETLNLEGGFKAISYNGIPVVADRFCPEGTMYLLNTDDFTLHQLCDWQWLSDDDGKVLKQVPGKPVYTATLVKYAELLCSRPYGQGMLSGITEE